MDADGIRMAAAQRLRSGGDEAPGSPGSGSKDMGVSCSGELPGDVATGKIKHAERESSAA